MTDAGVSSRGLLETDTALRVVPRAGTRRLAELQGDGEDDYGILQTLRTVWAGKWTVLLATALASAASAAHVHLATPHYTAAAHIVLETEQRTVVGLEGIASSTPAEQHAMNTELLVLRSHELMAEVVEEIGLDRDPEFNPRLRRAPIWRKAMDYFAGPASRSAAARDASEQGSDWPRDAVIEALLAKVRISIVPSTYAFSVTVETTSPETSAAIANTIAKRYIANQRAEKLAAMEHALVWLSDRVVELKQELETAETATEDYASRASTVDERMLAANMRKLQSMRERREAQSQLADELRARMARLGRLRDGRKFALLSQSVDEPKLQALAGELTSTPDDARLLADFDARLAHFAQSLESEAERLVSQSAAFTAAISELETEVDVQSSDLVNLRQLRREAEATRLLYEHFLARMKEISVQQGVQKADARLLSPAKMPVRASSPKVARTIAIGGMGGLVLGFCLVLVCDRLRATVRCPEELEAISGQSVIGVLPEAVIENPRRLLDTIIEKPSLGFAEAVRNLRASIRHANLDAAPRVVMLTSSEPDEGKTTVAAALALTGAMAGNRVLLVDADLRRRGIGEFFAAPVDRGLVSVLREEVSLEQAIFRDERTGLDVLFAESHEMGVGDLFESSRFDFLIGDLRRQYDLVVIDTPPVLVVPDARVIGQSVDALVYVVRWNSTVSRMVRTGIELLRQVSLPVAGVVLTRVDSRNMSQYGYYGYGDGRRAMKSQRYYAA